MSRYIDIHEDNIKHYLKEANHFERLTKTEEHRLINLTKTGDKIALHKLINANLNFVISVAKEFQGNGVSIGDLINDGNEGIIKAAFRFNTDTGNKFISYAVWWIRQSIIQGINDHGRMIRLPVNVVNNLSQVKQLVKEFEKRENRLPTIGEFVGMDKSGSEVYFDGGLSFPTVRSINKLSTKDGGEYLETIVDEEAFLPNPGEDSAIKDELYELLLTLNERERLIITLSFGLDQNFQVMTLDEIGERLNITKERVRQIKEKALRKLRFGSINLLNIINN